MRFLQIENSNKIRIPNGYCNGQTFNSLMESLSNDGAGESQVTECQGGVRWKFVSAVTEIFSLYWKISKEVFTCKNSHRCEFDIGMTL